ncbi:MAG: AMP-dependent synthetase [Rhodobacterales bacterium]|nr:MAG: AMP-dependent synthetase [Rhodobacterales bacterium]
MNVAHWLDRSAQATPESPALFFGTEQVADYTEFHRRAGQVATWLGTRGVGAGDRVGIFMKNLPEYLVVHYGIWMAGAVVVPINAKLHGREAKWILENAGAVLCFTSPGLDADLRDCGTGIATLDVTGPEFGAFWAMEPVPAAAHRAPQDLAWLFYTSGTTGRPKGVMITHRMLGLMALCYLADVDEVSARDTALYAAPLSHGAGLYSLMHVMKGARHVCPASGGFDEAEIFALARYHGRTHMFAAPTMVKRLTDVAQSTGETGQGLRSVVYGGGPMYVADIIEAVAHFGDIFIQIYGQGECPMAITALSRADVSDRSHARWRDRLGSVGRAQSAVELRIGDHEGRDVPRGAPGEIMVRGDLVMPGYWRAPEATARALNDGWLMTGDVGSMDQDGYVTMRDRSKDLIISGATNIYPREVEECLLLQPDVVEVSVVGRPHPEWGEEVVAFVVTRRDVTPERLEAHCLEHIARFKRPKAYVMCDDLPKNNYGKVLKTELRKMLQKDTPE